MKVKVIRKCREAHDICSFELVHSEGAPLPPFTAGAHIDVEVPDGAVRQYSLCNDPGERHRYRIGVLRDPASRGGSRSMHDRLQEGDELEISEPRNLFHVTTAAKRTLLLAGGIGITPLLAMAKHLAAANADFVLHYWTRSPERTAFQDEIRSSSFSRFAYFHFDDGPAEQRLDAAAVLDRPEPGLHVYACGPAGFLKYVLDTAHARGWPHDHIHFEAFSPLARDPLADDAFTVRLRSSGASFLIEAGRSVIEVLSENGVTIPTSCEQGICGTCLTRILEGVPDHRDQYLTDDEHAANDRFTPCCSRSRTAVLVLDL